MNKKILLAVAAMAFGVSLNATAYSSTDQVCGGVCQAANYFCAANNATKCELYRNQCDECISGLGL